MKRHKKPKPERLVLTVAERRRLAQRARKIDVSDNKHFFKRSFWKGKNDE